MQEPNADTEWNDVLRAKGIIPQKETEVSEDDIKPMLEQTIQQKNTGKDLGDMNLDELNEKDIDDEEYRQKRTTEMRETQQAARYGSVLEITKADWVQEVKKAGDGIWVIIHLYKQGVPMCSLLNKHIQLLAQKFPGIKFLRSVASVCIPKYPDTNLPAIFVYHEGDKKKQWIWPHGFHGKFITVDELEWMLSEVGAVKTTLEGNPRKQIHDVKASSNNTNVDIDNDDNYCTYLCQNTVWLCTSLCCCLLLGIE